MLMLAVINSNVDMVEYKINKDIEKREPHWRKKLRLRETV